MRSGRNSITYLHLSKYGAVQVTEQLRDALLNALLCLLSHRCFLFFLERLEKKC